MNAGYLYGYLIDFAVLSAKYTLSKITNYICLKRIKKNRNGGHFSIVNSAQDRIFKDTAE